MTGITNINVSSPSCIPSSGKIIPALLGALISNEIYSEPILFSISITNLELNPISISGPSYLQDNLSSALFAKSKSSDVICNSLPAILNLI